MSKKRTERKTAAGQAALNLVYQGQNGEHITGIPARDLTAEEVAQLTPEQRKHVLLSGLYLEQPNEVENES